MRPEHAHAQSISAGAPAAGRVKAAFLLPSFAAGGAQRALVTVASHLDRERFAPHLVVLDAAGPWFDLVQDDLPVTVIGQPRLSRSLPRLRRTLISLRPDVAVSTLGYMNLGLLALKPLLPSMRMVVREANTPYRNAGRRWQRPLYRAAYRSLYRRADLVVAPARRIADELVRDFGVPQARIRVAATPVDEAALRRDATPTKRVAGPGRKFVAVGRLTPQKGYDRLIDLLADASAPVHVTIFGEGPERASLGARCAALDLSERVALPGFEPDPGAWLAGADALLLPSRWEGQANAALEALACGTPVIAADEAGGIEELRDAATPGAVIAVPFGPAFLAAMLRIEPRTKDGLRPSLLPDRHRLANAVRSYEAILAGDEALRVSS